MIGRKRIIGRKHMIGKKSMLKIAAVALLASTGWASAKTVCYVWLAQQDFAKSS